MLITSPVLASLMVGLLIAVILPVLALGRRVRKVAKASQDRVADTSALAGEMLGAITTVQAFGREGYESSGMSTRWRGPFIPRVVASGLGPC